MKKLTVVTDDFDLTDYDPEKGLKKVAVADAGISYYARAKDPDKLANAVHIKLTEQRKFVLWWDGLGEKRGSRADVTGQLRLPRAGHDGMPERMVIERWRKALKDSKDFERTERNVLHRCLRICEVEKDGTIRGTEGTGEFERYTPACYINAARTVMGDIDLDPATSDYAQVIVGAANFFTVETDGLAEEWHGRIWLNPPYHRALAPAFIKKLVEEYKAGRTTQAVLLTNNSTDTDWFLEAEAAASICFTKGRINFYVPDGPDVFPTQGQAFFYFGPDPQRFEDVFCTIGTCMRPTRLYVVPE